MSTKGGGLALLSLITAPVALPATAVAGPQGRGVSDRIQEIREFCKDLAEEGGVPWLSVGECIALNISSDAEKHNFWVHRCDNWRDEGVLEQLYSSYAECVQDD